jgi:hypothetical protein
MQLNIFSIYYNKIVTDDTFDTLETDLSHCSSHRTPAGFVVGKQLIVFSNGKQPQRSFCQLGCSRSVTYQSCKLQSIGCRTFINS